MVRNLAEMPPSKYVSSFIFMERMHDARTTSLPVDGHGPHMNWGNRQTKAASLYNNQLVFLLCRSLRNYASIRTAAMEEKLAFWIQHCWSQLWQLRSISYGFTVIVYSSRLFVLYSCHLEERQTTENHLAHTNTGSYRHYWFVSTYWHINFYCS